MAMKVDFECSSKRVREQCNLDETGNRQTTNGSTRSTQTEGEHASKIDGLGETKEPSDCKNSVLGCFDQPSGNFTRQIRCT